MTSATSILGALPLALAGGAGAESRQAIGIAVVGGLVFSTVFTLVMIPVLHLGLIRFAERFGWSTIPPAIELEGGRGAESLALHALGHVGLPAAPQHRSGSGARAARRSSLYMPSSIRALRGFLHMSIAPAPEQHVGLLLFLRDRELGAHARRLVGALAADHDDFVGGRDAGAHARHPGVVDRAAFGAVRDGERSAALRLRDQELDQVAVVFEVEAQEDAHGGHARAQSSSASPPGATRTP